MPARHRHLPGKIWDQIFVRIYAIPGNRGRNFALRIFCGYARFPPSYDLDPSPPFLMCRRALRSLLPLTCWNGGSRTRSRSTTLPLDLSAQEGAPFSASLDRLEQRISDQIDGVVDVVLTGKLTALQHGCIENFIIAEVWGGEESSGRHSVTAVLSCKIQHPEPCAKP